MDNLRILRHALARPGSNDSRVATPDAIRPPKHADSKIIASSTRRHPDHAYDLSNGALHVDLADRALWNCASLAGLVLPQL